MNLKTVAKITLIVAVIVAALGVFIIKKTEAERAVQPAAEVVVAAEPEAQAEPLPKLVDLGATTCIPCKKMAPILDRLAEDFAGRMEVVFIDVRKDRAAGVPYKIRVIPTQIFYDPEGNELFRHEGFFSRDDILAKWAELGFDFAPPPEPVEDLSVTAYYLHWTVRCQGCLEIEALSRDAIFAAFADEMQEGDLQWITRDMDQPRYSHFLEVFDLSMPSLVLALRRGEEIVEHKVLAEVWEMAHEPQDLQAYVVDETRQFLSRGNTPAGGNSSSG